MTKSTNIKQNDIYYRRIITILQNYNQNSMWPTCRDRDVIISLFPPYFAIINNIIYIYSTNNIRLADNLIDKNFPQKAEQKKMQPYVNILDYSS